VITNFCRKLKSQKRLPLLLPVSADRLINQSREDWGRIFLGDSSDCPMLRCAAPGIRPLPPTSALKGNSHSDVEQSTPYSRTVKTV
jgi:hypothetical protein